MGTGEGEFAQLRKGKPLSGASAGLACEFNAVGFQRDPIAGDGVFDSAEGVGVREAKFTARERQRRPGELLKSGS